MAAFEALAVPPDAAAKGGHEVLRAAVVDGAVSVALRRAFDEPETWGALLVELARHAAHAYALDTGMDEDEAFHRIRLGLEAALDRPSDPSAFN